MKPGTRVLAIAHLDDAKVYVIGAGVYAGNFVPPKEIGGLNIGLPNPRIDLDNGKVVWGCECWWGEENEMKTDSNN